MLGGLNDIARTLVGQEFEEVLPGASLLLDVGGGGRRGGGGSVAPQGDLQEYARKLARQRFGAGHWPELKELVQRESSWDPTADNEESSAYGLFQFLDSTAQKYAGKNRIVNPYKQIRKGLSYIADRYGDPTDALEFHDDEGYY